MRETDHLFKRDNHALPYDPVDYCILAAATAVAWVFVIELDLTIFLTFRRRGGLYFWSLLVSSWGCVLHALGFILEFLVGSPWGVTLPFIEIGWVTMVTGQAFVLYSRLHLVVRNPRTLRTVLIAILVDAAILHIPTIVFTVGNNSPNADFWSRKFNIMERIQLVGFCLQEFAISTLYIVATVRILGSVYHSMTRKVMLQLILINCICIGMDIVLIGLEFTGEYVGEASIKPMIYAIKLKLEFTILNQLMGLSKAGFTEGSRWIGGGGPSHHSHELKDRTLSRSQDPEAPPPRKPTTWSNVASSVVKPGPRVSIAGTNGMRADPEDIILKTQDIDVVTEVATPGNEDSTASSSTAVSGMVTEQPPKVKSLLGTTTYIPNRGARESRQGGMGGGGGGDPTVRAHSPTESEKEIFRVSSDDEKVAPWSGGHV
ncbi:MAG: hypothetical protein Q9190_000187 [Brigantiaea leucoxantha]